MRDPIGIPKFDADHYRMERYLHELQQSRRLRVYYNMRPFVPRALQIAMRRAYAPVQRRRCFPRWPVEPLLVHHAEEELRRQIPAHGARGVPFVNFWPDRQRFCFVLTHDVEGPAGVENISRVREVEQRYGMVSAWYFVAEWYPIPDGTFDALRAQGCEIGLHGIDHRGKLFASRQTFDQALPKIHRYLHDWGADGFRSPALHRRAEWMPELGCQYDSSFPDTDPFEPQPGGCCSILPFFIENLVELPVTLPQDHTLLEILRRPAAEVWIEKARWVARHHGLVNIIVHPDYMLGDEQLAEYDRFLAFLHAQARAWHAVPRDVAHWWRRRADLSVSEVRDDRHEVVGPDAGGATVAYATERLDEVVIEV